MSTPQRSWTATNDAAWPRLATAPAKKNTLPAPSTQNYSRSTPTSYDAPIDSFQKVGPGGAIMQPDCQDNDSYMSKSFTGLDDLKLLSGAVPRSPSVRSSTPPTRNNNRPIPALLPSLRIETGQTTRSYRDVAKSIPSSPVASRPASPVLAPSKAAWLVQAPPALQLPQPQVAEPKAKDHFPPLSSSNAKDKAAASSAKSYATAAYSKTATGAPAPSAAKTITLNIGNRPVTPTNGPGPPPALSPVTPNRGGGRGRKKAGTTNCLSPPRLSLPERPRSASVSSIATSVMTAASSSRASSKATSIAPSPGPGSKKNNRLSAASLPSPSWESEPWYDALVTYARNMKQKNRAAWEKILRSDPKDTSKMKWNEFDSALNALGFKVCARGGSDLEYTPTRFGREAQPISYHRPHPGQEFSLGDLKAKSNSFRKQYPGAVAALHQAWGLTDTRL